MKEQHQSNTRNVQDYRLFALSERKSQGRSWALLTSEETAEALGLSLKQTARLFTRLLQQKRIQQIRRGLYLAPGRLPLGKTWQPSPYEILWAYMQWLKATWQITGFASFARYGFSTQVTQIITVLNDKLSGNTEVGGCNFIFIKLPKGKLGHINSLPMKGEININFSSKARTVFDSIYFYNRFGTIPNAYRWMRSVVIFEKDKKFSDELIECSLVYGNKKSIARIGFVLEKLEIDATPLLNELNKEKTSFLVPLVPFSKGISGERKGSINQKWKIIENTNLDDIFANMEEPDEDDI